MAKSFIQKSLDRSLLKATRLTGMGKLLDATRLIQRVLAVATPKTWPQAAAHTAANRTSNPEKRADENVDSEHTPAANDPKVNWQTANAPPAVIILPNPAHRAPDAAENCVVPARQASFTQHTFMYEGDSYPYRLYIPSACSTQARDAGPMPLVVLLHGCKQDALDFSNGTAMNALADEHQAMVLYPEQITSANAMRCWNWFEPGHQKAGRGEPGMIAALTQKIVQTHDADAHRVYIAGLSAGGAMAAVVSGLYPDIFAAVGVHSGLAAGAARDVVSAFGAMRSGAKGHASRVIPTIVFHGTADKTVHPDNGEHITDAALAALKASGVKLVETKSTAGTDSKHGDVKTDNGRAERVVYSTQDGKPVLENWRIDDGVHAWSGGDAAGSYTDPDGPSASKAMLAFFLQQRRPS